MRTRAESILRTIDEVDIPPYLLYSGAISAGIGAGHIANAIWQARRRTKEKVQQAGMGAEHQQARRDLSSLRRQRFTPHLPGNGAEVKQKYMAQKQRVKDIENRGLQQYHSTLAQNPDEHAAALRRDKAGG